jgi:uncharacterized protein
VKKIVELIEQEVFNRCQKYKEKTGDDDWTHTDKVTKYALKLAEMYNADKEIVALGALLHDISGPSEYGDTSDHHIYSSEIAESLLSELNYPNDRIEWVKNCVLNHRGSKANPKNTVEEECVADADALTHFDSIPSMFHFAYVTLNLSTEDGKERVKRKFENDYNKLSERTRELIKSKYNTMIDILFSDKSFI